MSDAAARIVGPHSVNNTEDTLYTVPGATQAIIQNVHICNVTGSAATIKLSIGADAVGTRLLSDFSVPANGTYDWSTFQVLEATETLRATGGTDNALTITVSGVLVT